MPPAAALVRLAATPASCTAWRETLAAPDEHRLISIGCELADGRPTIGEPLESYTGSEHWSARAAEAAAIGEALERYAGSYVPHGAARRRHRAAELAR